MTKKIYSFILWTHIMMMKYMVMHITQRLKLPSKLLVFPDENHWILQADNSKFMYKEVREWLLKWLK